MIHLDDALLVGRGTLRACYIHPDRDDLIIKVPLPDIPGSADANHKEMKSYRRISRQLPELRHISRCHGFVETDAGNGLLCDCIRDQDGAVSKTLWDIVIHRDSCDMEALIKTVERFCTYLIEHDIFLFDINLKNIALQMQKDANWMAWAIDLKGPCDNKEFLQLSSRITFLGRRKLKRRTEELLERIVLFREQRQSLKNFY